MRALKRAPCPCDESAKTHTAPRRLRSAPTSRKHCGVCTVGERNADAPLAAGGGSMVPRAPPAPSERQCANAALTGSGSISPEHLAVATYRRHASPRGQVVAIFRRNASPGCRPWQYFAVVRFRGLADGKMLAKCVPQRPTVARYRRGAFSGGDPWHFFRLMRSRRGLGREKRPFLAAYRRRASETSWLRQDMRAMHPKSPANGRSGMHRANILPGRGPFRCAGPSNHARHADLAVVRRLNEKDRAKPKNCRHFDKNTFKSSH